MYQFPKPCLSCKTHETLQWRWQVHLKWRNTAERIESQGKKRFLKSSPRNLRVWEDPPLLVIVFSKIFTQRPLSSLRSTKRLSDTPVRSRLPREVFKGRRGASAVSGTLSQLLFRRYRCLCPAPSLIFGHNARQQSDVRHIRGRKGCSSEVTIKVLDTPQLRRQIWDFNVLQVVFMVSE